VWITPDLLTVQKFIGNIFNFVSFIVQGVGIAQRYSTGIWAGWLKVQVPAEAWNFSF
jgi:hypothetical protein